MTTFVITNDDKLAVLIDALRARKRPFTVDVVKGRRRSSYQNRLQRLWLNEAAEQLGDRTPEELRAECKLRFGVPILRAENTEFAEKYDQHIKPLAYETKIAMMMEPLDFPVTRLMTTDQKTRYLEAMCDFLMRQGVVLTEPANKDRK